MIAFKHERERQLRVMLLLGLLLFTSSSCQTSLTVEEYAQVALEIEITDSPHLGKASRLTTITRVVVIVSTGIYETESYQELVTEDLSITGRSAQGTISVPMGKDRTFRVSAYDANEFIQYHGNSKSRDITEKTFTIKIKLSPIPPDRLTLSYNNQTGAFNWTKSTALDFASYRLYRAPSPGVTTASDLIYTTGAIDSTFYYETSSLSEGDYYYRVNAVDTENLISRGSNEVKISVVN